MLSNAKIGQIVRIHYRKAVAAMMPWHGHRGVVRVAGRGRPRNHGIDIDGELVVIPAGNLVKLEFGALEASR